MLLSETVQVKWVSNLIAHYKEKGYTYTKMYDLFECRVEDLMITSTVKVEVKCDYCEDGISLKSYRDYLKTRKLIPKDCCRKRSCMVKKTEESNLIKYGVKNVNQTEERKQQAREMFQTPKEEVIEIASSKGINILNIDDYENDRTRLQVVCEKHQEEGIQETNFANIKKNKNCCIHINKEIVKGKKKLTGSEAIERFIQEDLIPLFSEEEYLNNMTPLPYKCPKHLESGTKYRSVGALRQSTGCEECALERTSTFHRADLTEVKQAFIEKGLMPLNLNEYKNRSTKIKFICVEHKGIEQTTAMEVLRYVKVPCQFCREENSISILNKRIRSSIGSWINEAKERDGFKCVLTGISDFEVHHTYSYNSIISDALEILRITKKEKYPSNEIVEVRSKVKELHNLHDGVCLHPELHKLFHKIYSKHNNTLEQFEEFSLRFKNGDFNSILDLEEVEKERSA